MLDLNWKSQSQLKICFFKESISQRCPLKGLKQQYPNNNEHTESPGLGFVKTILHSKKPGRAPWRNGGFNFAAKVQSEPRTSSYTKNQKKCLDSNEDMSKEHRSQLEGAPTGKIWDNLSFYMCDEL